MKLLKLFFLYFIPLLLALVTLITYRYSTLVLSSEMNSQQHYDKYTLNKSNKWSQRYDFLEIKDRNSVSRKIGKVQNHSLEIIRGSEKFIVEYDKEIDKEIIYDVKQVIEEGDKHEYNSRYFLIEYEKFVEVIHSDLSENQFQLSVCLQLQIQQTMTVRYHIDESNNIWIITIPMNRLIYIQVYSCKDQKLIKEMRYSLKSGQNIQSLGFVNLKDDCMQIQLITYGTNRVWIEVCKQNIKQTRKKESYRMKYQQIKVSEWTYHHTQRKQKQNQAFNELISYVLGHFSLSPLKPALSSSSTIEAQENDLLNSNETVICPELSSMVVLHKNSSQSGLISLNKHLISTKTPLFHSIKGFDNYDLLKALNIKLDNEHHEFRFLNQKTNSIEKAEFIGAYRTYPDRRVHFLGVNKKILVFFPTEGVESKEYYFMRTKDGGVVSEGTRLKGTFENLPKKYEQIYQTVDSGPQQIMPGIFELHVAYKNLMTYPVATKDKQSIHRVDLLNMLGGKAIISHYISIKASYQYVSTMLLNNQWWILEYSFQQKRSIATKYQLYANSSNQKQNLYSKRIYGKIGSEDQLNGEDQLADLMQKFVSSHGNGYILVSVYRCIDEYYYFEYTDQEGSSYGIARIHFKNLSNRRPKKSNKYANNFEKYILVNEMLPSKYSLQSYSISFPHDIFQNIPSLIKNMPQTQLIWYNHCTDSSSLRRLEKYGNYFYLPTRIYKKGQGCGKQSNKDQQIYNFNMRNLIINAKLKAENGYEYKKSAINKIYFWLPAYLLILITLFLLSKCFSQSQSEVKPLNQKEKQKKKKA